MTAQADSNDEMLDQALAWQAALEEDDADWDAYMAWLEADPRHRQVYDEIALIDIVVADHREEIGQLLDAQTLAPLPQKNRKRLFAYASTAVAAAIALVVAAPMLRKPNAIQTYSANAQDTQTIALANGITVTLSPSSSITVRDKAATQIELAQGEAFFDVRHDPARKLSVSAGQYAITDIGTRFSVGIGGNIFRVGVSEGKVSVGSEGSSQAIEVASGRQLIGDGAKLTVTPISNRDVGSWRSGNLTYSDAPLPLVAADISRYTRKPVMIDSSLETSHFSGTLVIGDGSKLLSDLTTVTGTQIREEGSGLRIVPAPR